MRRIQNKNLFKIIIWLIKKVNNINIYEMVSQLLNFYFPYQQI